MIVSSFLNFLLKMNFYELYYEHMMTANATRNLRIMNSKIEIENS